MPRIVGNKSGTLPYIVIDWNTARQDNSNNRTLIDVNVILKVDYGPISYTANANGSITVGDSVIAFTANGQAVNRTGEYSLAKRSVWVNHNSDGTASVQLSAKYNLAIYWGGRLRVENLTAGQRINLARLSTYDTFRVETNSGSQPDHVQFGEYVTFRINRNTSSFTNSYGYDFMGKAYFVGNNVKQNSQTHQIPLHLMNQMITTDQASIKFWCNTFDESGKLLGTDAHWAAITVPDHIKPTITNVSITEESERKYRITVSAAGSYGSTISRVTQTESGGNTVNGADVVWNITGDSGTYSWTIVAIDSRGRQSDPYQASKEITLVPPPTIKTFTPHRSGTTVTAEVEVSGGGSIQVTVQRKERAETQWVTVYDYSYNEAFQGKLKLGTNYNETTSYDLTLTVTDSRGRKAVARSDVSTAGAVLSLGSRGIGVGKVVEHDRVLDVKGDSYFEGKIIQNGKELIIPEIKDKKAEKLSAGADLNKIVEDGFYYSDVGEANDKRQNAPSGAAFLLRVVRTNLALYQTYYDYAGNVYNRAGMPSAPGTWKLTKSIGYKVENNGEHIGDYIDLPSGPRIVWRTFTYDRDAIKRNDPWKFSDTKLAMPALLKGTVFGGLSTSNSSYADSSDAAKLRLHVYIDQWRINYDENPIGNGNLTVVLWAFGEAG